MSDLSLSRGPTHFLCCICFMRTALDICAEVAERRIAELEAERDSEWDRAVQACKDAGHYRPEDVVIIDGKWWRVDELDGYPDHIACTLVPVEDPDE